MSLVKTARPFTRDFLEEYINTGKNYIFSYPAGSGKTTAIREWIVGYLQGRKFTRKIIYVAPTQSLLDAMYQQIIKADGIIRTEIFLYHSNSPDYAACKVHKQQINSAIKHRIDAAAVILITHERMKFDAVEKFLSRFDSICGQRPLIFLDESIEDCNVVSTTTLSLDGILLATGLIVPGQDHNDFDADPNCLMSNSKRIYEYLSRRTRYDTAKQCHTIHNLTGLNLELANNVGFSEKSDLTDPAIEARFLNLYFMIAMTIAQKRWIEDEYRVYLNIPIAIHEAWKYYAQIIVTDATAFLHPAMCKDYEMVLSSKWNGHLITQTISAYNSNTRTKLKEGLGAVSHYLDSINLNKYRKIYVVTFLGSVIEEARAYLKQKYPDYQLEYRDQKTTEEFLASDIDNSTDELYQDSTSADKVIYLTNFGRTRGSNKFRDCDCVIQIGNYRLNPQMLNYLQIIYPGLSGLQITMANYVQELYRGKVRCGQKMDAYALVEPEFYQELEGFKAEFGFQFKDGSDLPFKDSVENKLKKGLYGKNADLIKELLSAKLSHATLTKKDIMRICGLSQLNNSRRRLLTLYQKYPEIRNEIFDKFRSSNQLKQALTLDTKYNEVSLTL